MNNNLTAAVDAAMVEMANISPPMRRSECERLIRAAFAASPVPPAADPVTRQYYYRKDGCKAFASTDPDCICWHDEGTGPLFNNPWTTIEPKSWRNKP